MTNKQTKQKRSEKRNRKKVGGYREANMHVITDKQNTFLSCSIFTYYFHMSTAVNRELINSTFSFLLTLEFDLWTLHKRTNDIYFVVSTDNKYIANNYSRPDTMVHTTVPFFIKQSPSFHTNLSLSFFLQRSEVNFIWSGESKVTIPLFYSL